MATGRIGVTPTLRTRWSKAPAGGTTSLSGLDDNSVSLVYDVGYEAVYRNGVLLSRTNDYTATTGNSITLIDATIAGDIIEVFANQLLPLTNAIGNGQYTAKGALLSATAASTPAVLTVGSNDQVLTADSTTSTGLKWATPAAGGMTLINTGGTTLTGSSVTISSIPGTYKNLQLVVVNYTGTSNDVLDLRINADTGTNYRQTASGNNSAASDQNRFYLTSGSDASDTKSSVIVNLFNYANTSTYHVCEIIGTNKWNAGAQTQLRWQVGIHDNPAAITSLVLFNENGGNFTGTTIAYLYGVK